MKLKHKLAIASVFVILIFGGIVYSNYTNKQYLVGSAIYQSETVSNKGEYILTKGTYFPPDNLKGKYKVVDVEENTVIDLMTTSNSQSLNNIEIGDEIIINDDVVVINVDAGSISLK